MKKGAILMVHTVENSTNRYNPLLTSFFCWICEKKELKMNTSRLILMPATELRKKNQPLNP